MKPGEELITKLEEMRKILNELHKDLNNSGVERTAHFLTCVGTDCSYYRKSLDLFLEEDYSKIRERIENLYELFIILETK